MASFGGTLCAKQAAAQLGIAPKTAQKLMRSGALRGFRIGRRWRTTPAEIDAYIRRQLAQRDRSAA